MEASFKRGLAALSLLLAQGCDDAPPAQGPADAGFDAAVDVSADVGADVPRATDVGADAGRPAVAFPLTFQDGNLPEFRFDVAAGDLTALLTLGHADRHPATLRYLGESYRGTIRQRLGNNSQCGNKRQFRFDFGATVTLPDGYRTDRIETDRGSCYVLHEWLATYVARRAAARHPELRLMWKRANAAAVYFNDALYHVQTVADDANRDVPERFLGTRDVTMYEAGCRETMPDAWLTNFCAPMTAAALARSLDVPTFLAWAAVVKGLSPDDNFPDSPWNWYLVRDNRTGLAFPLGDDWDSLPASWDVPDTDPYTPRTMDDPAQAHFVTLLADGANRARYSGYLREVRGDLDPAALGPVVDAKFRQIRPLLEATPDPPQRMDWYDFVYTEELPRWLRARYDFLGGAIR